MRHDFVTEHSRNHANSLVCLSWFCVETVIIKINQDLFISLLYHTSWYSETNHTIKDLSSSPVWVITLLSTNQGTLQSGQGYVMTFHGICPYPLGPNTISQRTRFLPVFMHFLTVNPFSLKVSYRNGQITPNTVTHP